MGRKPVIADQRTCMYAGLALTAAGAWLLYEAHEKRGKSRPFWLRLFGGWV
jgi:hypothetical protein